MRRLRVATQHKTHRHKTRQQIRHRGPFRCLCEATISRRHNSRRLTMKCWCRHFMKLSVDAHKVCIFFYPIFSLCKIIFIVQERFSYCQEKKILFHFLSRKIISLNVFVLFFIHCTISATYVKTIFKTLKKKKPQQHVSSGFLGSRSVPSDVNERKQK